MVPKRFQWGFEMVFERFLKGFWKVLKSFEGFFERFWEGFKRVLEGF